MVNSFSEKKRRFVTGRTGRWIGLCLILALATYIRFVNLRSNPGWYSDEGVFINYAENLALGRWQIFALVNSPMLIQRPPLFLFVLTAAFKLWSPDILVLRGLTAFYGVSSVWLLYMLVHSCFGTRLALLSAGMLAICPWIVAYNRMGFTYSQMAPLFLLVILACCRFVDTRRAWWAVAACLAAGLASATDYLGAVAPLLVATVLLVYDRRWMLPGVCLMGLILAASFLPVYLANPQGFWDDAHFTLAIRTGISPLLQIVNVVFNYAELIRRESWMVVGIIGLSLLPQRRAKLMILFVVWVTVLVTVRTLTPVGRGLHYLMHIFPFVALGLATFLDWSVPKLFAFMENLFNDLRQRFPFVSKNAALHRSWRVGQSILISGIVFLLMVSPIIWMLFANVAQSVYGNYFIFTGNDDLTLSAEKDVNQVVDYVRAHARPDALVFASPQIVWAVPGHKAEFPLVFLYDGKDLGYTVHMPRFRFAYSCSLQDAAYVMLDPLARNFATQVVPGMKGLIEEVEQWPLALEAGDIQVYRNPNP